jgi:hypothetical protein
MAEILIALAAVTALFLVFCGLAVVALASAHRRQAAAQQEFAAMSPVPGSSRRESPLVARASASQPQPAH